MNNRINTPVLWTIGICLLAGPAGQDLTLYVDAASQPGHGKRYDEAIS